MYYNNEKHLHICQSIFLFLYYKCVSIKIYLCTKYFFFIYLFSFSLRNSEQANPFKSFFLFIHLLCNTTLLVKEHRTAVWLLFLEALARQSRSTSHSKLGISLLQNGEECIASLGSFSFLNEHLKEEESMMKVCIKYHKMYLNYLVQWLFKWNCLNMYSGDKHYSNIL